MMKSSRGSFADSSRQNASTLGVWRRSRPKISSRCAPLAEVRFLRVARGGIAREAGGDDQLRAGAQQLQAGLVADLDPAAGEQRDAAAQVGQFGALGEIELRAGRAQLVVEVVDLRVLLLADVAVPQLGGFQSARALLPRCPGR